MAFAPSDNTIEIYINSMIDKRPQDTPADFLVDFDTSIRLTNQAVYQIAVKTASAPNTCPQFAENERSCIVLQEGESNQEVEIAVDRIYASTSDFLADLQTKLNALTTVDVSIAVDTDTNKASITNNSAGYLRLIRTGNSAKFWDKVGFTVEQETSTGYIEIASSAVLLSQRVPLMIRTQRYYLACRDVYNNAITKDSNYSQIIAVIDIDGSWGTYNSEQMNYLWYHDITNSNNIDSLSFYLLDDQRRPIQDLYVGGVQLSLIIKRLSN